MRKLVNPPPWSRCGLCSGEMRLKLIVPAGRTCDLESEIFVCANCGHERTFTVMHDPYTPHIEKTSAKTGRAQGARDAAVDCIGTHLTSLAR